VFTAGTTAVLLEHHGPRLIDALPPGITEVHTWNPTIDTRLGAVLLAPPLPRVDLPTLSRPPAGHSLPIAALLVSNEYRPVEIWKRSIGDHDGFNTVLEHLAERSAIHVEPDESQLVELLRSHLSGR
jgi:hypothetical protein